MSTPENNIENNSFLKGLLKGYEHLPLNQFHHNLNFYLVANSWGIAAHEDIVKLLDDVINHFFENLTISLIDLKPVLVINSSIVSPPRDSPEYYSVDKVGYLVLTTKDRFWVNYIYQFAHELCHHVMGGGNIKENDRFGWIDETFCELASLFILSIMADKWIGNPPYPNWSSYSTTISNYLNSIIERQENYIDKPLYDWINENVNLLYTDRYRRVENRIIAINLLQQFIANPILWQTIQHIKFIDIGEEMLFEDFIIEWEMLLPEQLIQSFRTIKSALLK